MLDSETRRYERQIILPQIGSEGQETLGKSSVLIAGAGGLGSISSLYLAAAGIGHILIADYDHVEKSNLNRQVLHSETSIGIEKVKSAASRIKELNSSIKITPVQKKLTADNIDSILNQVVNKIDIIVDACDNYKTRQILNQASIRHGIPFVFGGVQGFNGMVSCFIPGSTPCFECIIKPPNKRADKGIIGAAAGITASIQAMETIKLLLNIGTGADRLENRLLRISGLDMKIKSISLEPDPDCPVCRHHVIDN